MAERSKAPDSRAGLFLNWSILVHECGRGFESPFLQIFSPLYFLFSLIPFSVLISFFENTYLSCLKLDQNIMFRREVVLVLPIYFWFRIPLKISRLIPPFYSISNSFVSIVKPSIPSNAYE